MNVTVNITLPDAALAPTQGIHKTGDAIPRIGVPVIGYIVQNEQVYCRTMLFDGKVWHEYVGAFGYGFAKLGGDYSSCQKKQPDAWQYPVSEPEILALLEGE